MLSELSRVCHVRKWPEPADESEADAESESEESRSDSLLLFPSSSGQCRDPETDASHG